MNIFFLSFNPKTAAEYHCDKHVVKMILETAQLLYTAHWIASPRDLLPQNAYKQTHAKHPCAIWVRESLDNYMWLCELGRALCAEYTHRYKRVHQTQSRIEWLTAHPPALPAIGITKIRLAMPDEYKQRNPVESYRAYYIGAKHRFLHYTGRSSPEFLSKTRTTNFARLTNQ